MDINILVCVDMESSAISRATLKCIGSHWHAADTPLQYYATGRVTVKGQTYKSEETELGCATMTNESTEPREL